MTKEQILIVLAAMEAYRLKVAANGEPETPDYDMRVLQAILAEAAGIPNRAEWTELIRRAGLINYDIPRGDYKALKVQDKNAYDLIKRISQHGLGAHIQVTARRK